MHIKFKIPIMALRLIDMSVVFVDSKKCMLLLLFISHLFIESK